MKTQIEVAERPDLTAEATRWIQHSTEPLALAKTEVVECPDLGLEGTPSLPLRVASRALESRVWPGMIVAVGFVASGSRRD